MKDGMARNLNVAVQPAVADARWPCPRWISAATRLVGPFLGNCAGVRNPSRFPRGHIPYPVEATDRGRRSFVAHHENRTALSRLYRRAETLPRGIHQRPADQQGRARLWWRRRWESKR